jgi:PAS domain S-box-containing protein
MEENLGTEVLLKALLAAMDSAGIGCTVVTDRDGELRRAYSNLPFARMAGVTLDELARTPPFMMVAPDDRERVSKIRPTIDPYPSRLVTKLTRSDGSVVPVEVSLGRVPLESGQAVVAFLEDLTPRVEMEAALRESEERFRTIAESCPDSITMISDKRYVYANPAARRLLGIASDEELSHIDPMASVPTNLHEHVVERAKRVMAGQVEPPLEIRAKFAGRDMFLEVSSRLTTFMGRPTLISYSRDITERKELQARLMQQDRLASVGTLAAGLAHELNNPLTYLAFHLQRLGELTRTRSPEEAATLERIEEATSRMKAVISDLLFLTRDSDAPQAHVDVRQVIVSTIALVRAGAKPSTKIEADLAETSGLFAHPSRLGQVFLNVIRNALEAVSHLDDGVVRVTLREKDAWLEVCVIDNGVGVAEDCKMRVFDPFFTTKPTGTGLGLSISHAIVTAHGGRIAIESTNGRAAPTTTLTILLPKT